MANMSYCMYENTSGDMSQCIARLEEGLEDKKSMEEFLNSLSSDYERASFKSMYEKCVQFAQLYEELEGE